MPDDRRLPRLTPQGDTLRPGDRHSVRTPAARFHPSLLQVSRRLLPRDYTLALLLDEHRVLSTGQVTAALFGSARTCRNRLTVLRRIGFIDRFTPHRPGRPAAECWLPGLLAARYAALARDQRPPTAAAVRDRQDAVLASPQLDHLLGVNQFFVDLLAHGRANPQTRLARWWPAARAAAAVGRRVRPDGHGVWTEPEHTVAFWLEHDTGSESLGRLTARLEAYRRLRADGGPGYPVLFWLPNPTREANLHRRLTGAAPGVTVATAVADPAGPGPAGPVWRLAGNGRRRLRLAELPSHPGRPGPYHPPPAGPEDDPLRLLRAGS